MISHSGFSSIVSSLGWIDGGSLWCLDADSLKVRMVHISEGKYLSLKLGRNGYFSVVHHYDSDRLEITAHSLKDPGEILSRWTLDGTSGYMEGGKEIWENLNRYYVNYLSRSDLTDFVLIDVSLNGRAAVQELPWYDDQYDKGYQGIIGVTEIPNSNCVIVSIQRNSNPVIYDPTEQRKIGEITLSGNGGNPTLYFRCTKNELWADDYDTLLKIEVGTWRVVKSRRLQDSVSGTSQFIGQFVFDSGEKLCAVARPFSGDIVAIDTKNLKTRYRAKMGRQPIEVAILPNKKVVARDWKTGDLLIGKLGRTWFA